MNKCDIKLNNIEVIEIRGENYLMTDFIIKYKDNQFRKILTEPISDTKKQDIKNHISSFYIASMIPVDKRYFFRKYTKIYLSLFSTSPFNNEKETLTIDYEFYL